jgi:hypothetical protein
MLQSRQLFWTKPSQHKACSGNAKTFSNFVYKHSFCERVTKNGNSPQNFKVGKQTPPSLCGDGGVMNELLGLLLLLLLDQFLDVRA